MASRDELDVDARFLLANERTLLAWVRTALAFLAAGIGVQQFATDLPGRNAIAVLLLVIGTMCAAAGAQRFWHADRALRAGDLPHVGLVPMIVAVLLVVLSVAAIVSVVVGAI